MYLKNKYKKIYSSCVLEYAVTYDIISLKMKNRYIKILLCVCLAAMAVLAADIWLIRRTDVPQSTPAASKPVATVVPSAEPTEKPIEKTIYLTFDDGPYKYTGKLLDILDEYGINATFFVTNQNPEYAEMIKQESDRGHGIGVHTADHRYDEIYSSQDSFFNDFDEMQNIIKEQTGSYSKLYRFPGGSSNTISEGYSTGIISRLAEDLTNRGYKYFDWNVNSGDTEGLTNAEDVFENTVNLIEENEDSDSVVLLHDIFEWSVEAVPMIIEWGIENGYSFRALDADSPTVHFDIAN